MTTTPTQELKDSIRAAGGIVHKDGNIFFSSVEQFLAAALNVAPEYLDQAQQVCAEAYQAAGSMLSDLGQFETDHANKLLDNLSQHRMVHDDLLPWPSFQKVPLTDKQSGFLVMEHLGPSALARVQMTPLHAFHLGIVAAEKFHNITPATGTQEAP